MGAIDRNVLEQWDQELWRKPDVYTRGKDRIFPPLAIWYGPADAEGDVATVAEFEGDGYIKVSEYQDMTGYIDDPEQLGDEPILITSTYLDAREVEHILSKAKIRKPRSALQLIRWAVGLGVAYLAYYGGSEEYTDELPR